MNVQLLPRLTPIGVKALLDAAGTEVLTPSFAKAFIAEHSSIVSFAASGGSKDESATWDTGDVIRDIAAQSGFPDNLSKVAQAKFDWNVAAHLAERPELQTAEALRDDVWSYLATVVLPDVVAWRFPNRHRERYAGGTRNTFQRLWVRATTLDRGAKCEDRWELVRYLTEDAAVQIFERPSIASNRSLAKALAEGWGSKANEIGRNRMEAIMRKATKLLRLRHETIDLDGLAPNELELAVRTFFNTAMETKAQQ